MKVDLAFPQRFRIDFLRGLTPALAIQWQHSASRTCNPDGRYPPVIGDITDGIDKLRKS